ncbi:MAG: hypothetical protein ACRCVG_06455 [Methanobacteriaceae archaeon]
MEKGESNIPKKLSKKWGFKVVLGILGLIIILSVLLITTGANYTSPQNPSDIISGETGDTVFSGDSIIDKSNIRRYPVTMKLSSLIEDVTALDILGLAEAVSTGAIHEPISDISTNVTSDGKAVSIDGPGVVKTNGSKVIVEEPGNFVWGNLVSYRYIIKTENGVDILEKINVNSEKLENNNKTVKSIAKDNVNNQTVGSQVPEDNIGDWFENSYVGKTKIIGFGVSNFSDNRNFMTMDEVKEIFGENMYKYAVTRPVGNPVPLYEKDYTEKVVTSTKTQLGSFPQYNDYNRAFNAKQFVDAWNGTIVPPGTYSSGSAITGFVSSRDPKAPGGSAAHGVCPPARTLRDAIILSGAPMPRGMVGGRDAVLFGFNPGSEVKISNTLDNPIKIVMWTEGNGPRMVIYCKVIELVPNNLNNSNNT